MALTAAILVAALAVLTGAGPALAAGPVQALSSAGAVLEPDPGIENTAEAQDGDAADEADAARAKATALARAAGEPVPVPQLTDEVSTTIANPDGSYTTNITSGPSQLKQDSGWAPIDTALVADGEVLKPRAGKAEVEVSNGGSGPMAKLTDEEGRVFALQWPTALPKPVITGNVATFVDAAGPSADLVVTVLPTGFQHDVLLRKRPTEPLELRIPVRTEGVELSETKSGRLVLTDSGGADSNEVVASAPQPLMWDAEGRSKLHRQSVPIDTQVESTGEATTLVLKPDSDFLADPATTYPVTIDPTTTLPIQADTDVATSWASHPGDQMIIAGTMPKQSGSGTDIMRSYVKFNTSALNGMRVTAATLSLWNLETHACGSAVGSGILVQRVSKAWDQTTLTWSNRPTAGTSGQAVNRQGRGRTWSAACSTAAGYLSWPVTAIAQSWADGVANYGFQLRGTNEAETTNWRAFAATEHTVKRPPTLSVTYHVPLKTIVSGNWHKLIAAHSGQVLQVDNGVLASGTAVSQGPYEGWPWQVWRFDAQSDGSYKIVNRHSGKLLAVNGASTADGALIQQSDNTTCACATWYVENTGGGLIRLWAKHSSKVIEVAGASTADNALIQQRTALTTDNQKWMIKVVSAPSAGAMTVTPSASVSGVITTSTVTPTLRTTLTDSASGTLTGAFEVEHDPSVPAQGSGSIWSHSMSNVASGSTVEAAVPDGKLADGWLVRWRVRAISATSSSAWSAWQQVRVTIPDASSGMSTDPPVADGGLMSTLTPTLKAQISDSDPQWLAARFEWWVAGGDLVGSEETALAPHGTHTAQIPAGAFADGTRVSWRVRAFNAAGTTGPWSAWHTFLLAVEPPAKSAVVASSDFPENQVGQPVGTSGAFTFSANGQATVVAYLWDVDNQSPTQRVEAEAAGGTAGISYTPTDDSEHILYVHAVDAAGRLSPRAAYRFQAGRVSTLPVAHLPLDEGDGVTPDYSGNGHDATLTEGASASYDDVTGRFGLALDGIGGHAYTAGPVIRTDASFTVNAWVRLNATGASATAVGQDGTHASALMLGYSQAVDRWALSLPTSDSDAALSVQATSAAAPALNEWVHLAGVYDAAAGQIRLYVNGQLEGSAPISSVWQAGGPMTIGRAKLGGAPAGFWPGDLDEVIVYQRALSEVEIAELVASAG
ncbi:DNRLRE domain-containing protein [Planomonospora sp. ID67723]|uniref:LamG-like jellyroll fold domain-containing protein n=1 Tax=Planomonospora sp. ID67723 TaxID=2738134 RepID=UPI0018C37B8F|nr:LamG-like jellyroll fold domain-containing protein [Planomonospora sp. ID67723]MBG0831590.1 DNRLRE domain-containing protein [Planomonospora sp. ID67723]